MRTKSYSVIPALLILASVLFLLGMSTPARSDEYTLPGTPTSLQLYNDYVYVSVLLRGLYTFEIGDNYHLILTDSLLNPQQDYILQMADDNTRLYSHWSNTRLTAFDISDPTAPHPFAHDSTGINSHYAVTARDNIAYAVKPNLSPAIPPPPVPALQIIDFSDPNNPQEVGRFMAEAGHQSVCLSDEFPQFVITGGIGAVYDITDPSDPQRVWVAPEEIAIDEIRPWHTYYVSVDYRTDEPGAMHYWDLTSEGELTLIDTVDTGNFNSITTCDFWLVAAHEDSLAFYRKIPSGVHDRGSYVMGTEHGIHTVEILYDYMAWCDGQTVNLYQFLLPVAESPAATLPTSPALLDVYPNPFNATATATLTLAAPKQIHVALFNMLGQQVMTLADGLAAPGTHTWPIDASNMTSGIYLLRAEFSDGSALSHKVTLVR
ncbi:T9SS type A sorting domain-containing protein [bacterium]|nr:T9SS type A sorting domain-containing protein [bacterium]